ARTIARTLAFHPRVIIDLLSVRRSVEADLVRGLAGRLAERDLVALDELADRMRWRASRGQSFPAEDGEFHRRIAAASGNLVALALVDLYWAIKAALYDGGLAHLDPKDAPSVAAAHGRLVDALRRGDGELAGHVLRAHHEESERRFTAWLAAHDEGATDGVNSAVAATIQAALLWPGTEHGSSRDLLGNGTGAT
ncbi:MAG: FadR/GntR family transcriptional regulator, partial [Chloroflexota bacterium]